jgi:AraC-like DNA-binding protein
MSSSLSYGGEWCTISPVTVSARSAKSFARSASRRADTAKPTLVRAGTFEIRPNKYDVVAWHTHDFHKLEYAFQGTAEVETGDARFLLPPQQAVWIPATVEHRSTLRGVGGVSVFFDPAMGLLAGDRVRILPAAPVVREMVRYALRWPIGRPRSDAVADSFFDALAHLVVEWLDEETPLRLPTARDPLVAAAIAYSDEHISDVTVGEVCAAVATSERSLRRAFLADVGMSWRQYVRESRLLKAMALLAQSHLNVLAVAVSVGFESPGAFTRAFTAYTGETPSSYRHRATTVDTTVPKASHDQHDEDVTVNRLSYVLAGPTRQAI